MMYNLHKRDEGSCGGVCPPFALLPTLMNDAKQKKRTNQTINQQSTFFQLKSSVVIVNYKDLLLLNSSQLNIILFLPNYYNTVLLPPFQSDLVTVCFN